MFMRRDGCVYKAIWARPMKALVWVSYEFGSPQPFCTHTVAHSDDDDLAPVAEAPGADVDEPTAAPDSPPPLPPPALPPPALPPPVDQDNVLLSDLALAPRRPRQPREYAWGPFKIAPVHKKGVQIGWGGTCALHRNDNDVRNAQCKKTATFWRRWPER
jgi:hypothetical protein